MHRRAENMRKASSLANDATGANNQEWSALELPVKSLRMGRATDLGSGIVYTYIEGTGVTMLATIRAESSFRETSEAVTRGAHSLSRPDIHRFPFFSNIQTLWWSTGNRPEISSPPSRFHSSLQYIDTSSQKQLCLFFSNGALNELQFSVIVEN